MPTDELRKERAKHFSSSYCSPHHHPPPSISCTPDARIRHYVYQRSGDTGLSVFGRACRSEPRAADIHEISPFRALSEWHKTATIIMGPERWSRLKAEDRGRMIMRDLRPQVEVMLTLSQHVTMMERKRTVLRAE